MRTRSKARELAMEATVGTVMFLILLSLCFFTILLSRENIFKKTHPFEVVFEDVMGLRDGDNVVERGMTIGKVKRLFLTNDGVHVVAALQKPMALKEDYRIEVIPTSVLGGRHMQIYEGAFTSAVWRGEGVARGLPTHDLIAEASAVVADLKDISGKISGGQGTLGKLVNDDTLYNEARAVVGEINSAVKERGLLTRIENTASNLEAVTYKINAGEGTLGQLVNDGALYADAREVVGELKASLKERALLNNIEGSASNLNAIVAKINRGEGTLGKLVNDEGLYNDTRKLVNDARAIVDDYRETSPIVTFSSIFFGAF